MKFRNLRQILLAACRIFTASDELGVVPMAEQSYVRAVKADQHRLLPFLEGAAAIALPLLLGIYVLMSNALSEFYSVFGITLDQAGINQTVMLSRMATVIVLLIIAVVPLTCVAVTVVWLLNWTTGGRLRSVLRKTWQRPWGQALVVMLLIVWVIVDSEPSHLPWIIGGIVALVPLVTFMAALGEWVNRRTGGPAWAASFRLSAGASHGRGL